MKNKNTLFWIIAGFFALVSITFAQANDFSNVDMQTPAGIVQWLTPVIVPLLITGFRKLKPEIPSWVLPALAPVLGAVVTLIDSAIEHGTHSVLVGALLGLAGVGVREIKTNLVPPKDDPNAPSVNPIQPPPSP